MSPGLVLKQPVLFRSGPLRFTDFILDFFQTCDGVATGPGWFRGQVCEIRGTDSHGSHRRRRVACSSHRHITQITFPHLFGQLAASRWRDRRGSHLAGRQLLVTSWYLCIPLNGDGRPDHVRDRWGCVIFHYSGAHLPLHSSSGGPNDLTRYRSDGVLLGVLTVGLSRCTPCPAGARRVRTAGTDAVAVLHRLLPERGALPLLLISHAPAAGRSHRCHHHFGRLQLHGGRDPHRVSGRPARTGLGFLRHLHRQRRCHRRRGGDQRGDRLHARARDLNCVGGDGVHGGHAHPRGDACGGALRVVCHDGWGKVLGELNPAL